MKEAIYISHIGPIKEVSIEEIKPLTILIGSSASGKSTIMKIIVLMRYIYKMVNIRSYLKSSNISKSPFKLRFDSLLHDGLDKMIDSKSEIRYTVAFEGRSYTIEYKDKKLKANIFIEPRDLTFFKESFVSETRNMIPVWISKASMAKKAELTFYFHETFEDFNEATDAIKEQSFQFLNLTMKVQKGGKQAKEIQIYEGAETHQPFKLHNASSGIQTSVPLMVLLRYFAHEFSFKEAFRRSVLSYLFTDDRLSDFDSSIDPSQMQNHVHIHIEEPELSLDPSSQRLLLGSMVHQALHDVADDRKLGLMIATHSPYIVNQLNVLLKASYYEEAKSNYPFVSEDQIAVYSVGNGTTSPLMARDNSSGQAVINTLDLSDPMAQIYQQYLQIQ